MSGLGGSGSKVMDPYSSSQGKDLSSKLMIESYSSARGKNLSSRHFLFYQLFGRYTVCRGLSDTKRYTVCVVRVPILITRVGGKQGIALRLLTLKSPFGGGTPQKCFCIQCFGEKWCTLTLLLYTDFWRLCNSRAHSGEESSRLTDCSVWIIYFVPDQLKSRPS